MGFRALVEQRDIKKARRGDPGSRIGGEKNIWVAKKEKIS